MARPREFEPKAALERAMLLFWQKGYEETSMAELVEATGVSRYGLYSEFGDKQELFVACMDLYTGTAIEAALSPLEAPEASLEAIRSYFGHLIAGVRSDGPRGCLIGNTAVASPILGNELAERIESYYERMRASFLKALSNAREQGKLDADDDIEELADYLVGVVNGCLAAIRSGRTPLSIERFVRVALERLE